MISRHLTLLVIAGMLLALPCGCTQRVASNTPTPMPTLQPRNQTPQPGKGIVQGLLLMSGQPSEGQMMYLAKVIHSAEGFEVAALDAVLDPRIETDASGFFAFLDIVPGRYALGIMGPSGPLLVNREGKEIIVDVEAEQVSDLGEIRAAPFVP